MSSSFQRVRQGSPCEICGGTSWCWRTTDTNLVGCMRATEGGVERTNAKDGSTYRLFGTDSEQYRNRPKPQKEPEAKPERASDEECHSVYSTLMDTLELSQHHKDDLEIRGLEPELSPCKTWRMDTRFDSLNELKRIFGLELLLKVPGFYMKENSQGVQYLEFSCFDDSMIIPVYDINQRISCLKSRVTDEMAKQLGQRYVYSSSRSHGGPSCGVRMHIPLSVTHDSVERSGGALRITEGELKSEVACRKSIPTIGVPGVSSWQISREVIQHLDPKIIVVAYDADARTNPHVERAKSQLIEWCESNGYIVHDEQWPLVNAIDDALSLELETSWTPFEAEFRKLRRYMRTRVRESTCHDNDACRWLWEVVLPRLSGDTVNPVTVFEAFLRRLHKENRTPSVA